MLRLLFLLSLTLNNEAALYEGDSCIIKEMQGVCTNQDQCPHLREAYMQGKIRNEEIPRCGYTLNKEVICCPIAKPTELSEPTFTNRASGRTAIEYCRELQKFSATELEFHVVNGLPVKASEYRFMAAIGYKGPNDLVQYFCGGTLISDRFVLTAAHCVNDPKKQPSVVMLGHLNLNEVFEEVIIGVKKIEIHPDFHLSSTYNDIALIELENAAQLTATIHPACLFTNSSNPPGDWKVFVAGWGRTEHGTQSNSLMKAELSILSLSSCRSQLAGMTPTRRLSKGIQEQQICAIGDRKDACEGDSGGPLIYESPENDLYVGGIVAAGLDCVGITPAIYTRIASYLDFIENIVWPQKN